MKASNEKKRETTSKALIKLRKTMSLTQQQLAFALDIAVPTVGRWEANMPPEGKALDRLAAVALAQNQPEIANVFLKARADGWKKAKEESEFPESVMIPPEAPNKPAEGYLFTLLEGRNGLLLGQMVLLLKPYLRKGDDKATAVLQQLCKGVEEVTKDNPQLIKLAFAAVDAVVSSGPIQIEDKDVLAQKSATAKKKGKKK